MKKSNRLLSLIILATALAILFFAISCQYQKQDTEAELQKTEKVLYDFFNALSEFDYQGVRQQITDDFQLLEDGLDWNADSLIKILKFYEPNIVERLNTFEVISARQEGSIAWISYWNDADIKLNEGQMKFRWLESAVFQKQQGVWKIELLHSTQVLPTKG